MEHDDQEMVIAVHISHKMAGEPREGVLVREGGLQITRKVIQPLAGWCVEVGEFRIAAPVFSILDLAVGIGQLPHLSYHPYHIRELSGDLIV